MLWLLMELLTCSVPYGVASLLCVLLVLLEYSACLWYCQHAVCPHGMLLACCDIMSSWHHYSAVLLYGITNIVCTYWTLYYITDMSTLNVIMVVLAYHVLPAPIESCRTLSVWL